MTFDPVWEDTLAYSGHELRRADLMMVMGTGSALDARSGVRPGDPGLTTTLAGSTISVGAGAAIIHQPVQGVYRAVMGSAWSGTLNAADATYTRIDLVYLRVWDDDVDASGLRQADVVYLPGTASATPSAPTPSGTQIYLPLATITVPPSGGGAASVSTAVRPYTVAPGGILPSSSAPSSPYTGQPYHNGTDLLIYNGSGWDTYQKVPGAWTSYTPTWTTSGTPGPSVGNGTLTGRYQRIGRTITYHINLIAGSTTAFGTGTCSFALPVAAASSGCTYIGSAHLLGSSRWGGQFVISPGATEAAPFFPNSSGDTRLISLSSVNPETLTASTQVRITGVYESAT